VSDDAAPPWTLHPDRALPAEPGLRAIARQIHAATRDLPIVSMHGHVLAAELAADAPFPDPARLLVVPDHYLVRMLVSRGETLPRLGVPALDGSADVERDPREIWRRFCAGWRHFRGTPTRFWLEHELVEIFGATVPPSPDTADLLYDQLVARLAEPGFRPRALLDRFGIEVLATTDPAWDTLEHHTRLAEAGYGGRVVPTFRPDPLLELGRPGWRQDVDRLAAASGVAITGYATYLDALREQRRRFVAAGARATDHGHLLADTAPLPEAEASALVDQALRGVPVSTEQAQAFVAHMLFQMAAMSTEDGLVMQLHPGSLRDHSGTVAARYGADRGYDIPVGVEFTRALRPLLEAFGNHPRFRLVVFTMDESVYSRELAPLAGVYPALLLGAPWWFLDSPDGMRRFRERVTETAGFSNTTGFVDDTRAFCSIPARHDLARRIDAGYLARLVAEHRLPLDEAVEVAVDLAYVLPKTAYAPPTHPNRRTESAHP